MTCFADIDECASSPCLNGGTCHDLWHGFTCECLPDLYRGRTCKDPIRHRYYQHGWPQADFCLGENAPMSCDWRKKECASRPIRIPNVQFFHGAYQTLHIYTNGYVTLGMRYQRRQPRRLNEWMLSYYKRRTATRQGMGMLAPLWTDNNAWHGTVCYHIYDLTQPGSTVEEQMRVKHAIDHARDDVIAHGGVSVTRITWVMVITWTEMLPRRSYNRYRETPNTFQLVIAYDPSRYQTFVMFVYVDMGWDTWTLWRPSMIGYFAFKHDTPISLQLAPSMKTTAFRLHARTGNTGKRGVYMFRVASGKYTINYDYKCRSWYANEMRRISWVRYYWWMTRVCPCDSRLAWMDGRWRFDYGQYYRTRRFCFYERMPWGISTQECCYAWSGFLVSTQDGRGGQTFLYHPRYGRLHVKYDVTPKEWCCQRSDNCHLFYRVRPMDRCWGYQPLFIGWFYGDPHIRTLDGFQYTFNGLGEYTLIETTHGNFTLQGRTAKARDANGTETDATVFSAFAARDAESDTIHIEMTASKDDLAVFVQNENVTDWFTSANVTDDTEHTDVTLTKKNTTQIEVTFKSGFTLTIGVTSQQLDITVGASEQFKEQTKGLMGVFNGDPTDDLLPPGENARPLANSSSEKSIFEDFGELWRIQKIDSIFYYAPGEGYSTFAHTEFKPLFLEDVLANMTDAQLQRAKQTCGDNKECLFDFAVTGKEDAAAATLATNSKNEKDAVSLVSGEVNTLLLTTYESANASPNITVVPVFNVTAGEVNTLLLTTYDPDGDTVIVNLTSSLPDGATFQGYKYTWRPVNMDPVNISFTASDGKEGIAAAEVSVRLCNCSGQGECLFDNLAEGYEMKNTFAVVQCNCSTGWEGDFCELDLDGCQDNPCTGGTNCTDLTPEEQMISGLSFNCSECPKGTEDDDGICLHIDECKEDTSDCEQECMNTEGGYKCSCVGGYTLNDDNATCTMDVDECAGNNGWCEFICTNFDGGFNCSCNDGFQLMNDKKHCQSCPSGTWGKDCLRECSCRDSDTECNVTTGCDKCPDGFMGPDCHVDVDECRDNSTCDSQATCSNTVGTYKCVCHSGFTQYNTTTCQDLDECESDPCENGAECVNGVRNYTCLCVDGYTGYNCQTDVNECANEPCQNNAVCQDLVGKYRCACVRGYTGKHCETEIDICDSNPCKNGANCTQNAGKYACNCVAGLTGLNCDHDIDDCAGQPCLNGGVCVDQRYGFVCNCTAGYTGSICETGPLCTAAPCLNGGTCVETNGTRTCHCVSEYKGVSCQIGFISTLSLSKIARLAVTLRLVDREFTSTLGDKSSSQYEELKSNVVDALKIILNGKLGTGKYKIVDVTFSSGSLVVTYDLDLPKESVAEMQTTVLNAIKTYKGKVAGSSIDSDSVTTSEKLTVRYYGQFRIPKLKYLASYSDDTSAEYVELAKDVKTKVEQTYRESGIVNTKLIGVSGITFTNGSVIVDFSLWLDASLRDLDVLREIFTSQKSLTIADKPIEDAGLPWLGVVLGSVVGLVFFILFVILVIFAVRKCRSHHRVDSPEEDASTIYSSPFRGSSRLWQARAPTMPVDPAPTQHDRMRMNIISNAVKGARKIDWSMMQNFARRNVGQKDDLLRPEHQRGRRRRNLGRICCMCNHILLFCCIADADQDIDFARELDT
ncbi:hypothetical protein NP493_410g01020 [Ridgeia piscesae]|uniref:Mucin-like protein n=1 Tax=Ridgeia piscesae TaxID=27915 RepID=A0AAD9L2C3_RIDPI|nr:hypothetical protein NP493_410g01020 [Ridgeia piscesae]